MGVSLIPEGSLHPFFTSWCLPPAVLGGARALISLYAFATIFVRFGLLPSEIDESFSYFTNITLWGLAFYFLVSAYHTLRYSSTGRIPLESWGTVAKALHAVYYATITTYPLLVTIVYWVLLADKETWATTQSTWTNISTHALNSVYCLFEIIFPRTVPPTWITIVPLVLFLAMYLGLAYVTKATQGFYTYDFLDPAKGTGRLIGYIFGILAGTIVVHLVVKGVIWLRKRLTEGKGVRGKFSRKDTHYHQAAKDDVALDNVQSA